MDAHPLFCFFVFVVGFFSFFQNYDPVCPVVPSCHATATLSCPVPSSQVAACTVRVTHVAASVPYACALGRESPPFAIHGVVSNSAIIRLSPLPSSFPSPLPLSCGSIHILITAFPSPALRHSIRALPASGFALLLPPLCDRSLFSEAHQK